jgi:hypothetical protein
MMPVELIKAKNILLEKRRLIFALFFVFLVISAFTVYNSTKTKYEAKEIVASQYTQYGSYTYNVPVTEVNPLYPVGSTLPQGKPAYFTNVAPSVDMIFSYNIDATDTMNIAGDIQTLVVASGTVTDGDNKTNYWEKEFTVKTDSFTLVTPEPVSTEFAVNVPDIQRVARSISDQLNYSDDTTLSVVSRVTYHGTIGDVPVQNTTEYKVPITVRNDAYYQIPNDGLSASYTDSLTKDVVVKKKPTIWTLAPSSLLFVICAILCLLIATLQRHTTKVEPAYIAMLEKQRSYAEFDQSISPGIMPEDHPFIEVNIKTLKALVIAATDMNSRVIFDESTQTYFTISGSVIYTFVDKVECEKQEKPKIVESTPKVETAPTVEPTQNEEIKPHEPMTYRDYFTTRKEADYTIRKM